MSSRAAKRWAAWPAERLLDLRLRDLGLAIEGSWLERPIARLREELAGRDLRVNPHFWLAEEWFSPEGVPGIAIPFYLAHPRLKRLERSQMLTVEGGTMAACLKILRHEAGHVVQHAFALHRRKRWQRLFGPSSAPYPDHYRPNPASRRHVVHLDHWYGQSHPDEDFAETFAVWLAPSSRWRKQYADWPALEKLEYVDELMVELAGRAPRLRSRRRVEPISRSPRTLREHYDEKRRRFGVGHRDAFDEDLRRVFSDAPRHRNRPTAAAFLRAHRREIRALVAKWTGGYDFTLDQVFREMLGRCTELRLRAAGPSRQLVTEFSIMLAARTMKYLYRQRSWHAL